MRYRLMYFLLSSILVASCGFAAPVNQASVEEKTTRSLVTLPADTTLIVYSGRSEALIKPVVDAFMAENPSITVLLKAGKDSELAAAILEEQANPQADVFITTNMLTTIALAKKSVLSAHEVPGIREIPERYQSKDKMWTPITLRARVIMYNTNLVSADQAPKSFEDLADPKWKGKIAAANSTNGSMQAHIATLIAVSGTRGAARFLEGLVANETTFFGGHTDVRKAVGAGEFAIGIVNHYYYELQRHEPTDNAVAVVYSGQEEGESGLIVNATAAAIIKNSPHPEAAKKFLDFLFETKTQRQFAELNYEYPIVPKISLAPDVRPIVDSQIISTPFEEIAGHVAEAAQLMGSAGVP